MLPLLRRIGTALRDAPGTLWLALRALDPSIAAFEFALEVQRREPMDDETFWATSYKKSGVPFEIATTVRRVYGEQLGHDHRKLRSADFDPQIWDIDTMELVMEMEEAFGISISDREAERTSGSINSLVRLIATKLARTTTSCEEGARTNDAGEKETPSVDRNPARRTASSA